MRLSFRVIELQAQKGQILLLLDTDGYYRIQVSSEVFTCDRQITRLTNDDRNSKCKITCMFCNGNGKT